ncbi:MAG: Fic family protein [Deltaproteobacteria bacterium]|nr:Fic family protein [Deltaproteobacteria bacterium]
MTLLPKNLQESLERRLHALNKLRPLPHSAVQKLREHFKIEMTYNSNAIEGNSLTLKETFLVINEGITVKGKPLKDHLEAKDHHAALEYLYELVEYKKQQTLSEQLVRTLHQLITRETEEEWAGRYRESNVFIGGADHTPPDAIDVPLQMKKLIDWFQKNQKKLPIVELAALFHHRLVFIHPFLDGNGRTARLAMNLILMKAGYPLVVVLKNDRKKYYRVLSEADKENPKSFVQFVARAVERSLDIYLKTLTPISSKERERFLPLFQIAEKSPYSAKYLNLLIRQGKLEAHKEGRIWFTSQEALKRYQDGRQRKRE